jgi:hypothetical protein
MAGFEEKLSVPADRLSNLIPQLRRLAMTFQKAILTGLLLLVSVASLAAQNSLPNPHDDSCWSSLSALRACQVQAYDQAQAHAQDCTSYPEYQCNDYYQPQAKTSKAAAKTDSSRLQTAPTAASIPPVTVDDNVQASGTN